MLIAGLFVTAIVMMILIGLIEPRVTRAKRNQAVRDAIERCTQANAAWAEHLRKQTQQEFNDNYWLHRLDRYED